MLMSILGEVHMRIRCAFGLWFSAHCGLLVREGEMLGIGFHVADFLLLK